jgi:hypothetical protein
MGNPHGKKIVYVSIDGDDHEKADKVNCNNNNNNNNNNNINTGIISK